MPILTAAVVVFGVLTLLNLLLTFGMLRRLRQHAQLLSGSAPEDEHIAAPGTVIGEFAVTTADDTVLTSGSFPEPTLVGFFSPGCQPCEELIPGFLAVARGAEVPEVAGVRRAVAVIADGPGLQGYVDRMAPVVTVVAGSATKPMEEAFMVQGFPSVCVVGPGGRILASGTRLVPRLRPVPA